MDLLNMLLGTMTSDSSVSALAGKTGANNDQIMKLIKIALPILLKFLTQNASSGDGVAALLGALTGHSSTARMADQIADADEEDGEKIVGHILGTEKDQVITSLAEQTELSTDQVDKSLASLAPALMSGLSAATNSAAKVDLSDGLDLSDLMGLFGGEAATNAGGLLGGLLGGNGSGLGSLLGGLFGGSDNSSEASADTGNMLLSLLTAAMKQ